MSQPKDLNAVWYNRLKADMAKAPPSMVVTPAKDTPDVGTITQGKERSFADKVTDPPTIRGPVVASTRGGARDIANSVKGLRTPGLRSVEEKNWLPSREDMDLYFKSLGAPYRTKKVVDYARLADELAKIPLP